jgi:hypothetical protein
MFFPSVSTPIARCPLCQGTLTLETIRASQFDCPHCTKLIRPVHRRSYLWLRGALCAVVAVGAVKLRGFDWSFLIFVISLYALPALFFWDVIVSRMFPPTKFEPVPSPVQTLGISSS